MLNITKTIFFLDDINNAGVRKSMIYASLPKYRPEINKLIRDWRIR